MRNVNDEIAFAIMDHRHNLAMVEGDIAGAVVQAQLDRFADLLDSDSLPVRRDLLLVVERSFDRALDAFTEIAERVSWAVWEGQRQALNQAIGFQLFERTEQFSIPFSQDQLADMIASMRERGTFKAALTTMASGHKRQVIGLFKEGLANGWGPQRLQRELFNSVGGLRWQWSRLVRTEMSGINNRILGKRAKQNRRTLLGERYSAALDSKTCMICASFDGNVYYFQPTTGQRSSSQKPLIPWSTHSNCRCFYMPVVKPFRQIGKMIAGRISKDNQGAFKGRGKAATALNYSTWFGRQDGGLQAAILGPTRKRLFDSGVPVSQFAANGRIVPVESLLVNVGGAIAPEAIGAIKRSSATVERAAKAAQAGKVSTIGGKTSALAAKSGVELKAGADDALAKAARRQVPGKRSTQLLRRELATLRANNSEKLIEIRALRNEVELSAAQLARFGRFNDRLRKLQRKIKRANIDEVADLLKAVEAMQRELKTLVESGSGLSPTDVGHVIAGIGNHVGQLEKAAAGTTEEFAPLDVRRATNQRVTMRPGDKRLAWRKGEALSVLTGSPAELRKIAELLAQESGHPWPDLRMRGDVLDWPRAWLLIERGREGMYSETVLLAKRSDAIPIRVFPSSLPTYDGRRTATLSAAEIDATLGHFDAPSFGGVSLAPTHRRGRWILWQGGGRRLWQSMD